VDPFDGGPHLWAGVDEILPVKKIANFVFTPGVETFAGVAAESGLICKAQQKPGEFRAVAVQVLKKDGKLAVQEPVSGQVAVALGLAAGDAVVFMPYY